MKNTIKLFGIIAFVVVISFIALSLIGCATTHTVSFSGMGATGTVPPNQRVPADTGMILPGGEGLSLEDAVFSGWIRFVDGQVVSYNPGENFIPTGRSHLRAHWKIETTDFNEVKGLVNQLVWIMNNAENNSNYIIEIQRDEMLPSFELFSYYNRENITITLRGVGANRTIKHTENKDTVFYIYNGISLVIDNNITIDSSPPYGAIVVVSGGNLTMNSGSIITGSGADTGVAVSSGTFIMNNGATITGIRGFVSTRMPARVNIRTRGNGVSLNGGTFTMNQGATISNCNEQGVVLGRYARSQTSTFIMNGGTISGNGGSVTVERGVSPPEINGGGVAVFNGTFTMNGGLIDNNVVAGRAGGVFVGTGSVFTMTGGEITRNSAKVYIDTTSGERVGGSPGGLFVSEGATFNMSGGNIVTNTSDGTLLEPHNVVFFENPRTGAKAIVNRTGGNIHNY
ncbi:MAG: hypothetical protein FWD26_02435 [Treponema sp.]|nr:hypothetical protein [Treponema sp.]